MGHVRPVHLPLFDLLLSNASTDDLGCRTAPNDSHLGLPDIVLQNLSQQEALSMSLMSHAHHRAHISDVFDTMAFIAHLKSLRILTEIRSPSNVRITKLIGL